MLNLLSTYHQISKAIEHVTFALSTPNNLQSIAQSVPQHEDRRAPVQIDNLIYSEQILTEILQQLQQARRNLYLLVDGLILNPKSNSIPEILAERPELIDKEAEELLKPLHEFEIYHQYSDKAEDHF